MPDEIIIIGIRRCRTPIKQHVKCFLFYDFFLFSLHCCLWQLDNLELHTNCQVLPELSRSCYNNSKLYTCNTRSRKKLFSLIKTLDWRGFT